MSEPHKLKPATAIPVPAVIEILELALKLAKDGELRDIVISGTLTGGMFYHACKFTEGPMLAGQLSAQLFLVNSLLIDRASTIGQLD
jgi:hypothetical protein